MQIQVLDQRMLRLVDMQAERETLAGGFEALEGRQEVGPVTPAILISTIRGVSSPASSQPPNDLELSAV